MRRDISSKDFAKLDVLIGCQPIESSISGLGLLIERGLRSHDIYSGNLSLTAIAAGNAVVVANKLLQAMREEFNIWVYTHIDFDKMASDVKRWIKKVEKLERDPYLEEETHHNELLEICQRVCAEGVIVPFECTYHSSTDVFNQLREYLCQLHRILEQLNEIPRSASDLSEPYFRYLNAGTSITEREEERRAYAKYRKTYRPNLQKLVIYLLHRMRALASDLRFPSLSPYEIKECVNRLAQSHLSQELLHPSEEQIPENTPPLAEDRLIAYIVSFLDLSDSTQFPLPDKEMWVNYLIENKYHTGTPEGKNIVRLLTLFEVMMPDFEKQMKRPQHSEAGDYCPQLVSRCNACLAPFLYPGCEMQQLNELFKRWLRGNPGNQEQRQVQENLKRLLFKGKTLQLRYYLYMVHIASDTYKIVDRTNYEAIWRALSAEGEVFGYSDSDKYPIKATFRKYLSATSHHQEEEWQKIQTFLESYPSIDS